MARDRSTRPEARPLRLFVAVDVPEEVRDRLAKTVALHRDRVPGARWAPPENWHVTLKFLGSVDPPLLDWVLSSVGEAASEHIPFMARLSAMGAFPSAKRARVVWAGLEDRHGELVSLARSVDRTLEREFPAEQRPFSPHLTLARLKEQAALPEDVLSLDVKSEPFRIATLRLYRSYLGRPSARYEVLREFPLSG